jgi:hypothetical protein
LERDPAKRMTNPYSLKQHPFFAGIDFDRILQKEVQPPYIPNVVCVGLIVCLSVGCLAVFY